MMLDNITPHVSVVLQAVQSGKVVATTLSDESGRYSFANLTPGDYQVRCYTSRGYVCYQKRGNDKTRELEKVDTLHVESSKTLKDIDFRFAPFKKGVWRHYSTLDGLAHNTVNRIHIAPDGFMWLGTDGGGISRYDGKDFISFSSEDGLPIICSVWMIYTDCDGIMWFGIYRNGAYRYDGKKFTQLADKKGTMTREYVFSIGQDSKGLMYFGTHNGVYIYDPKEKRFLKNLTAKDGLMNNSVRAIITSPNDTIIFITDNVFSNNGFSRYDGKNFDNFPINEFLLKEYERLSEFPDKIMTSNRGLFCYTQDGQFWHGSFGLGAFGYDGKQYINLTTDNGLPHNWVMSIQNSPDKSVCLGMWGGGISRYDHQGLINFSLQDGLLSEVVKDLYVEEDGAIWVASGSIMESNQRGGLSRYDPNSFVSFSTKDGLSGNNILSLHLSDDGILWIGTLNNGVSRYNIKTQEFLAPITMEDGLAGNSITSIYFGSEGIMWFGSGNRWLVGEGISRYDTVKGKCLKPLTVDDGLVSNNVYTIYGDDHSIIWFGTDKGVSRYDTRNGEFLKTITTEDGLANDDVHIICCDSDGVMWFTSRTFDLLAFEITSYDGSRFINFHDSDDGRKKMMAAFHHDKNEMIWTAQNTGLIEYDGRKFQKFTRKDGLAEKFIRAIYPYKIKYIGSSHSDELVLFGTDSHGVSMYDGTAWSSLDIRDGLAGNTVMAITRDSDGSYWFGTQDGGLTRYRRSSSRPKAYIVSVTTDQTYQDLSAIPPIIMGTRITIEYSSIDFKTIPEKRQYRCRIKEIDKDWRKTTKETTFDWIPEKPGTYIFELQAIDRDLNYSEPAKIKLDIQSDPDIVSLQTEVEYLRQEMGHKYSFENIKGKSSGMMRVRELMARAVDFGMPILITGETGTGKELVAKAIHNNSSRSNGPLRILNCAAIPGELVASTLFGYRKGAFTGALENRKGLFEEASGGTLLLDEIGDMPEDAQSHLLRVFEERSVIPVGDSKARPVDVQAIAMTNQNLEERIKANLFREDLFFRFGFIIHIPPLRERPEDIKLLAEYFLDEYLKKTGKKLNGFTPEATRMFLDYSWPGNVRQLHLAVASAVALADEGNTIQVRHFPAQISQKESLMKIGSGHMTLSESIEQLQRHLIEDALRQCNGNHSEAAQILGVHRPNLIRMMKRLDIE